MGVTLHYRAALADLSKIDAFERLLAELGTKLGAEVQVWRSASDADPTRVVRGVLLTLHPEADTVSFLVSPEGWLVSLTDIEAAERGELEERPWVFVKTQFAPIEVHVTLVEILAGLRDELLVDLEVEDESGYWLSRDLKELQASRQRVSAVMDAFEESLGQTVLAEETKRDPEALADVVAHIAERVRIATAGTRDRED